MKKWIIIILLIVVGVTAIYYLVVPSYRYKLGLEVEVDGQPVIGWSVIEITATPQPQLFTNSPYVYKAKGDAVYLDLGNNRNVVMTLRFGPTGAGHRLTFLAQSVFQKKSIEEMTSTLKQTNERRELADRDIPTLVTFANPTDPQTVRVVKPEEFAKVFGPGVHFKRAWIEMTQDSVTSGIKKKLPWAGNYDAELVVERLMREPDKGRGDSMTPGNIFTLGR